MNLKIRKLRIHKMQKIKSPLRTKMLKVVGLNKIVALPSLILTRLRLQVSYADAAQTLITPISYQKTCPHCRTRPVNSSHIDSCNMKGVSRNSGYREAPRRSFRRGPQRTNYRRTPYNYNSRNDNFRNIARNDQSSHQQVRTNNSQPATQQFVPPTAPQARFAKLENGVLVLCNQNDDNAILIQESSFYARPRTSGKFSSDNFSLITCSSAKITACADSGCTLHLFQTSQGLSSTHLNI